MTPTDPPLIVRIEPKRPRGLRLLVHLDRGEPFEVTLEALERSRLGLGDPLTAQRRHHLLNDDADVRVRDAAFHLISYRARTRAELRRRLIGKSFRPARVDLCLERLQEKGFLDDGAVAEAFVRDRLRHRPKGRAALTSELRAKGVSSDLAAGAVDRVFEEADTDDVVLARSAAEKWVRTQSPALVRALISDERGPERDRARRRLRGYLARRGFSGPALAAGIEGARQIAFGEDA